MKFTFTDKKVNLPKSLHNYAEKKVGKLDRYFKTEAEARNSRVLRLFPRPPRMPALRL